MQHYFIIQILYWTVATAESIELGLVAAALLVHKI